MAKSKKTTQKSMPTTGGATGSSTRQWRGVMPGVTLPGERPAKMEVKPMGMTTPSITASPDMAATISNGGRGQAMSGVVSPTQISPAASVSKEVPTPPAVSTSKEVLVSPTASIPPANATMPNDRAPIGNYAKDDTMDEMFADQPGDMSDAEWGARQEQMRGGIDVKASTPPATGGLRDIPPTTYSVPDVDESSDAGESSGGNGSGPAARLAEQRARLEEMLKEYPEETKEEREAREKRERRKRTFATIGDGLSAIFNLFNVGERGAPSMYTGAHNNAALDVRDTKDAAKRKEISDKRKALLDQIKEINDQEIKLRNTGVTNDVKLGNMAINQQKADANDRKVDSGVSLNSAKEKTEETRQNLNEARAQTEGTKQNLNDTKADAIEQKLPHEIKEIDSKTNKNNRPPAKGSSGGKSDNKSHTYKKADGSIIRLTDDQVRSLYAGLPQDHLTRNQTTNAAGEDTSSMETMRKAIASAYLKGILK